MKKLTTNLSTAQRFYLHDWEFLQTAVRDAIAGLLSISGSNKCIISGCVGAVDDFDGGAVTEGWIFFDGELRYLPAKTFAANTFVSGKEILVRSKSVAVSPSPQQYPDGVSRDTYLDIQAESIADVAGTSGTHVLASIVRLEDVIANATFQDWMVVSNLTLLNGATVLTGSDQALRHRKALAEYYEIDGGFAVTGAGAGSAFIDVFQLPITLPKIKIISAYATDASGNVFNNGAVKISTTGMLSCLATNAGVKYYLNSVRIPLN